MEATMDPTMAMVVWLIKELGVPVGLVVYFLVRDWKVMKDLTSLMMEIRTELVTKNKGPVAAQGD